MIYTYQTLTIPFQPLKECIGFLDIETSGLCKQKSCILLIGLGIYENHVLTHHTWYLENPEDEVQLIIQCINKFKSLTKLYTYNGSSFDLSFLQSRAECYGLSFLLSSRLTHVDFKKLPLFKAFLGPTLTRQAIESKLQYKRHLQSSGRQLAQSNTLYLNTKQTVYKTLMASHHKEDLESLIVMYSFYRFLSSFQHAHLNHHSLEPDTLILSLHLSSSYPCDLSLCLDDFLLNYKKDTNYITLSLSPQKLTLKQPLNPKDYFVVNNTLMHHSLAQFIPSSAKKKATKKDAYIERHDTFIPHPNGIWQNSENHTYALYDTTLDPTIYFTDFIKKIIQS